MVISGFVSVIIQEMIDSSFRCIISVSDRLIRCVLLCCFGGSLFVRMVINIRLLILSIIFRMISVNRLVQIEGFINNFMYDFGLW